jgi:hypothetical protein
MSNRGKIRKGEHAARLDALKKRGARFRFGMKREEGVKILPAVIAVILIAGILSGLIIANVSSLFQTSSISPVLEPSRQ